MRIKNKYVIIILPLIICTSIFLICPKDTEKITLDEVKLKEPEKNSGMFAIMLQSSEGSEDYTQSPDETFPKEGYTLNQEKSGCLDSDGKKLENVTLSYTDGKVTVETGNTSYCYIYFDMKPMPKLVDTIKGMNTTDVTELGNSSTNNDGYLIYHDGITGTYADLEAGDKSYRFSGNNPDNYVCLDGNTGTDTCDKTKLYRVIGIFPKEENSTEYTTKIIKSEYITTTELGGGLTSRKVSQPSNSDFTKRVENNETVDGFLWSGDKSVDYNNWRKSKLNETLNSENGTYLQSLSKYIDLIEDTKWYIGGNEENYIIKQDSMKAAYNYELGANKLTTSSQRCVDESGQMAQCREDLLYEDNKKVGLMYATEYGYASAPRNWSSQLYNYNNTSNNNREENWLYNGVYEWTISRLSANTQRAFYVSNSGDVLNYMYSDRNGVRPVLVLKSNATVKIGDGSKNSPWRINLQSS